MKTRDLTICAFSYLLMILCSKFSITIGLIPITLQTLAVILCGLILTKKQILFVFSTYIISGLCGLPVFSNGGGFAYILQPSFGFILSFPIAAYTLAMKRTQAQSFLKTILYACIALCIIYSIGTLYMAIIFEHVMLVQKSVLDVLMIGVIPFLWNDLISSVLACVVAKRVSILQCNATSIKKIS